MASRGNPNTPRKARKFASRKKVQQRKSKAGRIGKTSASSVLHPTSGPAAPVSAKRARKLEKAQNYARQRALEKAMAEQGEVVMTGAYGFHRE